MNKYLEKLAAELKPHQVRSVDKLMESRGVLLNHSTGSGKTMTILEAIRRIQELHPDSKQLVITPASLTTNIKKEIDKHDLPIEESKVETISFDKAVNDINRLNKNKYSLVSIDEAHKLRNTDTRRFKGLENLISKADYRILATATPIYNSPADIGPLINLVSGEPLLPKDKVRFENRYVAKVRAEPKKGHIMTFLSGPAKGPQVGLKNVTELQDILKSYVDTYNLKDDPDAKNHFPSSDHTTIAVPMSQEQEKMYKYLEGDIPVLIRMKIRHNLPLDKKESAMLNAFSTGVRQASNSVRPYVNSHVPDISPKIKTAVNALIEKSKTVPNFRAIVYSNYLEAGLKDYAEALQNEGISHNMYHGGVSVKDKDQIVRDYNSGKTPVLLISSSGAEGIDLKGTKLIQVLEPHFNNSKIQQVTGRGIRFKSHEHLPKDERHVAVQHFASVFRPGTFGGFQGKTIDQYLKENSLGKDAVAEKITNLLKTAKVQAMRKVVSRRSRIKAEKLIDFASNVNDAHDTYQSGKKKYKKMKKQYG